MQLQLILHKIIGNDRKASMIHKGRSTGASYRLQLQEDETGEESVTYPTEENENTILLDEEDFSKIEQDELEDLLHTILNYLIKDFLISERWDSSSGNKTFPPR